VNRVKELWDQLGAKLGILLCLGGFVALWAGWNGAASYDRVPAQFPYLISGGIVGLGLIVIGAAMIVVDTNRQGRDELQATLAELRAALEGMAPSPAAAASAGLLGGPGTVVAGASSYHRPDCHLVDGKPETRILSVGEAEEDGLAPCRICKPAA
jgi:hypothetical protein